MSVWQKAIGAIRRAVGTTPDAAELNARLAHILAMLERQEATIAHVQHLLDTEMRREFDSLAATQAEGIVYFNRTMREIQVELSAPTTSVSTLENPAIGQP